MLSVTVNVQVTTNVYFRIIIVYKSVLSVLLL